MVAYSVWNVFCDSAVVIFESNQLGINKRKKGIEIVNPRPTRQDYK